MAEQHENKDWRNDPPPLVHHIDLLKLIGAGVLVGLVILLARAGYEKQTEIDAFDLNLTTEIIGIVVTVLIINWFNERREKQKKLTDLQKQLVEDAASPSNEIAKHAIHTIRRKGWLEADASILRGKNLVGSNLEVINLSNANLRGTYLDSANQKVATLHKTVLTEASLRNANLQGAHLISVDLRDAFLTGTALREAIITGSKLQNAKMVGAMLQNADLTYANLQNAVMESVLLHGTNLSGANLQGARLEGTVFNEDTIFDVETILPDGTYWSEGRDFRQFTDRNHPDFHWYYSAPK